MKKQILALCASVGLLIGCASLPPAPKSADGGKMAVAVQIDGGWDQIDTSNPNQVSQRKQLVNYMNVETVKLLKSAGYAATLVDSAHPYSLESKARLLNIKVTNYNPGSAAARMLVGLGAGAATLNTHSTYKEGTALLFETDHSVASGRDWRKIVRKVNVLIQQEMAKHPAK